MEIKVNSEIRNYKESMFFGLSMRQSAFALCGMGVAVLLYFALKPHLSIVPPHIISSRCRMLLIVV